MMHNSINLADDAKNQKLNEELYLKYSLQEINSEILIMKYQNSTQKTKKIICSIFKERGFNRDEIEILLNSLK